MARTTVADVLTDGLIRAGVGRIFAAPGRGPLADALRASAARRELSVIEAPTAAAVGVLAAVCGEIGEGPGGVLADLAEASDLLRGLAHAQRDRAPLIVITDAGPDTVLLAPVVKASLGVEPAAASHWIAHAANLALTAPRGPVHLALSAPTAEAAAVPVATACRPGPLPVPDDAALDALAHALTTATRPLIVTGLECGPNDAKWLRAFAETVPAPVLATWKGRGVLADPHPLALGVLAPDHPLLARPDLIVAIGVDPTELPPAGLPSTAPIAHVGPSAWPAAGLAADVIGDIALVIEEMAPRVRARRAADWDVAELDRIKRAVRHSLSSTPAGRMVALAREATPAGTIATGDVPALAAWSAVAPRETLGALGLATPGYALMAAIAARLTYPDRRVVAFTDARGLASAPPGLASVSPDAPPITLVSFGGRFGGVDTMVETTEAAFAGDFARAWTSSRTTLLSVGGL